MKPLVLALFLLAAADGASLGVGLDVLPTAYTFAANRMDFFPDLRLTGCDRTGCRWATGHGTDLVAYVSEWDLAVTRLEADSATPAQAGEDQVWFQRACASIVALTLSDADRAEVRSIAETISPRSRPAPADHWERAVGGIRFYGRSASSSDLGGPRQACGAAVLSRD